MCKTHDSLPYAYYCKAAINAGVDLGMLKGGEGHIVWVYIPYVHGEIRWANAHAYGYTCTQTEQSGNETTRVV